MVVDPFISTLIRYGFALMFALSSLHKFRGNSAFREVLHGYEILPPKLVPFTSYALAACEMCIVVLLISFNIAGLILAIALLFVYALIMAFNIARGHTQIDCGCFWGEQVSMFPALSWKQVARNAGLVLILSLALVPTSTRPLTILDILNLGVAVGFGYIALSAYSTLKGVYIRMQEYGHA